jgi:hypothetical protein
MRTTFLAYTESKTHLRQATLQPVCDRAACGVRRPPITERRTPACGQTPSGLIGLDFRLGRGGPAVFSSDRRSEGGAG